MTRGERERLMEEVASAWRPRDPEGRARGHPAWHDLDEGARLEAARAAARLRIMESALDAEGLSTTAHAVLARIRAAV